VKERCKPVFQSHAMTQWYKCS